MLGVMFYELAQNFKSFQAGDDPYKLRFYVGHDGSMIRLASGNFFMTFESALGSNYRLLYRPWIWQKRTTSLACDGFRNYSGG
jgi:hypothetical protein